MVPTKTDAVVLALAPFRESSFILRLFTKEFGLIHGIAKGIRNPKNKVPPLERGFVVELLVYHRHANDLHVVTEFQLHEFFPETRQNVSKSALRDVAFELLLKAITLTDPHPELYIHLVRFLNHLENQSGVVNAFVNLWIFIHNLTICSGFEANINSCAKCGSLEVSSKGGKILIKQGALHCASCASEISDLFSIPSWVLDSLQGKQVEETEGPFVQISELVRITKLLLTYCCYHFDISNEYKSLAFIERMLESNI